MLSYGNALALMYNNFFDNKGIMLSLPIPAGTSVNANYYEKALKRS